MSEKNLNHKENTISFLKKIKRKVFSLLRLNHHPVIKVYHGFGNNEKIIVLGQVLKLSPYPRQTYRENWIINLFSILRLFMVIPFPNAKVVVEWEGNFYPTQSESDGFFRLEISPPNSPKEGWHQVSVKLEEEKYKARNISGIGSVYIPFASQNGFISDIDDTFLISYSARLRRRLYTLFTKNAHTRKPFEGVVNHYQLLANSGQEGKMANPFFYVSGSEWNLYDFLIEFSKKNQLPKGVFLLSQLKNIKGIFSSGQKDLSTKFMRIVRIVEAYPHLKFILLGDDSQHDPEIYLSIVSHFPDKIIAVYLRNIHKKNFEKVKLIITEMESKGVSCCYFKHSAEAVSHSKKIGLII
jgi:phosphatidate phosphatase APP1